MLLRREDETAGAGINRTCACLSITAVGAARLRLYSRLLGFNLNVKKLQNGVWKPIRLQEPTTITQQSLGNGDGTETVFGPLASGDSAFPVPNAAQNVIVLVENVFQLSTTNYTLEQSVSGNLTGPNQPYADGYYIKFTQAVPVGKPVTVLHNFDK